MFYSTFDGNEPLDWLANGIESEQLAHLRCVLILEGQQVHGPPLAELLKTSSTMEPELFSPETTNPNRVRDHPIDIAEATTRVPSIADEEWHKEHVDEAFLAYRRGQRLRQPTSTDYGSFDHDFVFENNRTPSSSSGDPLSPPVVAQGTSPYQGQ